jgi:hypothetical protein
MNKKRQEEHTYRYISWRDISMKKGKENMYDIILKDKRKNISNGNFFLKVHHTDPEAVKFAVSQKMMTSLNRDVEEMVNYITRAILEDWIDERK